MERFQRALILGYGRSGRAAERLLRSEDVETVVLSRETTDDDAFERVLAESAFAVCVVSPGFGLTHPWVEKTAAKGIPLLSELELGWSRHRGRTLAVTGSNGKSTAVKWVREALVSAGKTAEIGGNYGVPACEVVLEHPDLEWLVLEVSSFQLETVRAFHADVAVLLNVLPNHLDRHGSMEAYRKTKARIFGSASAPSGACVVPADLLEALRSDVDGARAWLTFGGASADFHYEDGRVYAGEREALDLRGTGFESPTIGACAGAAAAAVAHAAGIRRLAFETAARNFEALPHRLRRVGAFEGVVYVNDSKATNLAALAAAVAATRGPIHLIAGGILKETDLTFVKEILAERVTTLYVIGQASRVMMEAWSGVCPCVESGTLEKAFQAASDAAVAGQTVLLSPGCASFDQFQGFEDRGERFEKLVLGLKSA